MKTQGPRHTANSGLIFCRHCGKIATYQLVYDVLQVAHLLRKNGSQVRNMMKEGKLEFRYELKTGWSVRRVVDYFQLWDYINNHLPRPSDLASDKLNPTMRAIARILEWERDGQKKAKITRERKRADKQRQQSEPET